MTEVLFYHLQGQKPENVLPTLLERGWRVAVQGALSLALSMLE